MASGATGASFYPPPVSSTQNCHPSKEISLLAQTLILGEAMPEARGMNRVELFVALESYLAVGFSYC